jgi:hypothetical protein
MKPWEKDWGDTAPEAEEPKKPWERYSTPPNSGMQHRASGQAKPVRPTGNALDLLRGVGLGIDDLGQGIWQRLNEFGVKTGISSKESLDALYADEAKRRENREFNPEVTQAERFGRGTGMLAGTLPLAFTPAGKTAVSSTLMSLLSGGGAGAMFPATSGKEAMFNVAAGAGGQAAGNLLSRALLPTTARNLTQAQKDVIDAAEREGIRLRTSEATGSNVIRNWEQIRANRPITGGMEQRFNNAQTEDINRAFTRKLGKEMPEVNKEALKGFQDDIGGEISALMKGKTVKLQDDFFDALVAVDADANVGGKLTASPEISRTIDNALDLIVNRPTVSGDVAKRIRSKLMDRARDARAAENTELANGLEDIVDGLKKAMEGTLSTSEKALWRDANRRYARYKLVEEAFIKDPRSLAQGDVPINKMARVMEQNRPRSYVHGTGDFADLATLGQVIRPPGRSALLGESSIPIARNVMDVASGAVWPVLESKLMQRYLTGGLPGQRLLRDSPRLSATNDALMRAAGLSLLINDEATK